MVRLKPFKYGLILLIPILLLSGCQVEQSQPTPTAAPLLPTLAPTLAPTSTAIPPTSIPPTPAPGETRTDPQGIEQVWVPAGSFLMGTSQAQIQELLALDLPDWVKRELPSEQPQHEVRLTHGYWIDRYEVTNGAFQFFIGDGGYEKQEYWSEGGRKWLSGHSSRRVCADQLAQEKLNDPCVRLTWYEAEAYAAWRGGRLPSEAEWEYAARGPESWVYPWGDTFDSSKANVLGSSGLTPVGSYPQGSSWVGAQDMAGNAMEWVQDWLDVSYYKKQIAEDPPGPETGSIKIEKGGWWGSNEFVARSAYRHYEDPPTYGDEHIGFRIVSP